MIFCLRESVDVITFAFMRMLLNLVGVVNVALPQVTDGMVSQEKNDNCMLQ